MKKMAKTTTAPSTERWVISRLMTSNTTLYLSRATTKSMYIWDVVATAMVWSSEREANAVIERVSGSTWAPDRRFDYKAVRLDTVMDNGR